MLLSVHFGILICYFLEFSDAHGESSYMETQFRNLNMKNVSYPKEYLHVNYSNYRVDPQNNVGKMSDFDSAPSITYPSPEDELKFLVLIEYFLNNNEVTQSVLWMVVNIDDLENNTAGVIRQPYVKPKEVGHFYLFLAYKSRQKFVRPTKLIHTVQEVEEYYKVSNPYAGNILCIKKIYPAAETLTAGQKSYMENQFENFKIDANIVHHAREYLSVNYPSYRVDPGNNALLLKDVALVPNVVLSKTDVSYEHIIMIDYNVYKNNTVHQTLFWMIANIKSNNFALAETFFDYKMPTEEKHFYIFLAYKTDAKIEKKSQHFNTVQEIEQNYFNSKKPRAGNILHIKKIIPESKTSSYIEEQFKMFGINKNYVSYPRKYLNVNYPNYALRAKSSTLRLSEVTLEPIVTFPYSLTESFKLVIMIDYQISGENSVTQILHWMVANIKDGSSNDTFFPYKPPTNEGHIYLFLAYKTTTKLTKNNGNLNTVQEIEQAYRIRNPYAGNILYIERKRTGESDQDVKLNYMEHHFKRLGIDKNIVHYPNEILTVQYSKYTVNPENNFMYLKDVDSEPTVTFPTVAETYKSVLLIDYYVSQKNKNITQALHWMIVDLTNGSTPNKTLVPYKAPTQEGHFYIFLAYKTNKSINQSSAALNVNNSLPVIQNNLGIGYPYAGNILYIKKFYPAAGNFSSTEEHFKLFGIDNSIIPYPKHNLQVIYPTYEVNPTKHVLNLKDVEFEPFIYFPSSGGKYKIVLMIEYYQVQDSPYVKQSIHWLVINRLSNSLGETIFGYKPPSKEECFYLFLSYESNETKHLDAKSLNTSETSVRKIQSLIGMKEPYSGNILFVEKFTSSSERTMFATNVVFMISIIICHFLLRRN